MLIERGQRIAGLDAVVARELMRAMRSIAMSPGRMRLSVDLSAADVPDLVARLESEGYIERHSDVGGSWRTEDDDETVDVWITTVRGNALAKARIGRPMPRAKAEKLLETFLDRIRESNADPDELYWVDSVELYGSLADPNCLAVGDVDLLVMFDQRHLRAEHDRRAEEIIEQAHHEGRSFKTWFQQITWPQTRFERRLRASNSLLDVQFEMPGGERRLPEGAATVEVYTRVRT